MVIVNGTRVGRVRTRFANRGKRGNADVKNMVKSMIMSTKEIKRYSLLNSYNNTVAGVVTPLSQGLVTGLTLSNRVGSSINPVKLEVKLSIIWTTILPAVPVVQRILIVRDNFNTGVVPLITDILDGGVYDSTTALQTGQQHRFTFLYDNMVGMSFQADSQTFVKELSFKLKGELNYNGDTNVATANGEGSLFMFTLCNSITGGNQAVNFYASLTFTDS